MACIGAASEDSLPGYADVTLRNSLRNAPIANRVAGVNSGSNFASLPGSTIVRESSVTARSSDGTSLRT